MSGARASAGSCVLEPAPAGERWRRLLHDRWESTRRDDRAMRFRAQLGLPTDAPIVMTGHQPIVFHPGVLAKYLAAHALAASARAHTAWLVVDQDETDPGLLAIPARDAHGDLMKRESRLLPRPPEGVPAGVVPPAPPAPPSPPELQSEWAFVNDGLARIASAFSAHAGASSLAEQGALAAFDLMRPLGATGLPVLATRLARTDLFRDLADAMRRDPLVFVEAYNRAVDAHPEARVAPLLYSISADRYELPLWRLHAQAPRRRAYAEELDDGPVESFAPRAILMTLLVRLAGCDLFIHGAGGWVYDRICEDLARTWLGETLAPMTLATATRTLPLLDAPPPNAADVANAKWRAHRAAHDPAMLGDEAGARVKRALLAAIASAPRRSPERAAAFRAMHDALADARDAHAPALRRVERAAEDTERAHMQGDVALERAWPFPLYPQDDLFALRDEIMNLLAPSEAAAPLSPAQP